MKSNALRCPVCGTNLGSEIPDFCPICGWECGTDITLHLSLNEHSLREVADYEKRLNQARDLWQKKKDDKEKLRRAEEEKEVKLKEIAAKCSALKTRINALTRDQKWAEALQLLDEYDELKDGDKWAAEERKRIVEKRSNDIRELDAKYSALKTRITDLRLSKDWSAALSLLDEYENLKDSDYWSSEQRKLIERLMTQKPIPEPKIEPEPQMKSEVNSPTTQQIIRTTGIILGGLSLILVLLFGLQKIARKINEGLPENMVFVEDGSFIMGDTHGEGTADERPAHRVILTSYYIGRNEVTQAQWRDVMGKNPAYFKGDDLPVEQVSWYDAVAYCNELSAKEGLTPCYNTKGGNTSCDWTANGYRLPTEAEWEYAARGGINSNGYKYSGSNDLDRVGSWHENSPKTSPVGTKEPNELGINDMTGNVWEWCWDWYRQNSYTYSQNKDLRAVQLGSIRIIRGGSILNYDPSYCTVFKRNADPPNKRSKYCGFRVVRNYK